MKLIIGLGNPGREYEHSRHNAGFDVMSILSAKTGIPIKRIRCKSLAGEGVIDGCKVALALPQTFMNLSGEAVVALMQWYKVSPEDTLIILDDIDLDLGRLRIRAGGSAGGHNGLKNIIAHLGSDHFPRIKVGVGMPDNADYDIADWVTGYPMGAEQKPLMEALDKAVAAVPVVIREGVDKAQNQFN